MDLLLWVDLVRGGCASGEASPGQLPGHTRCAVAIDPGVVEGSQNDRKLQILEDCNSIKRKE